MIPVGPFQGRLAREPKLEHIGASQFPKWSATVAVDEPGWDSQKREVAIKTVWVLLQAVGSQAEELWAAQYGQGDEVAVVGRLGQFTVGEGEKRDTKTHVVPLIITRTRTAARRAAPPPQYAAPGGSDADPWGTPPPPAIDTSEPPF